MRRGRVGAASQRSAAKRAERAEEKQPQAASSTSSPQYHPCLPQPSQAQHTRQPQPRRPPPHPCPTPRHPTTCPPAALTRAPGVFDVGVLVGDGLVGAPKVGAQLPPVHLVQAEALLQVGRLLHQLHQLLHLLGAPLLAVVGRQRRRARGARRRGERRGVGALQVVVLALHRALAAVELLRDRVPVEVGHAWRERRGGGGWEESREGSRVRRGSGAGSLPTGRR